VVLNHLAAILFFAGPLFYFGLWIAVDPDVFARPLELLVRGFGDRVRSLGEPLSLEIGHPKRADISRKIRLGVRFVGVVLVLLAIAV
jgi:hypothetical protein